MASGSVSKETEGPFSLGVSEIEVTGKKKTRLHKLLSIVEN